MRVGEILLERGWVDWDTLAIALTEQRNTHLRLCSLLVARRAIDFDQAARALGEQHGTASVLRHHLVHRDRSVASLLPAAAARRVRALPIGRLGDGTLIVCVRDPSDELLAELSLITGEPVMLAVAPARFIDRLVDHVYTEVDVPIDVELPPDPDFDLDVEVEEPDIDIPVEFDLTEPKPKSRALPVQVKRLDTQAARDSLDATIAAFPDIDDAEWLLDVAMGYVAKRWAASLILAIEDRRAVGMRGHGQRLKPSATRAFILPLSDPSVVQLARDQRRVIDDTPPDAGKRIAVTLDNAARPIAAPIVTGSTVTHVIVVGDPLSGDHEDSLGDLEVLTEALGEALTRIGS
jgi:hypothetical protein